MSTFREIRVRRLAAEHGGIARQGGDLRVALVYPSPYPLGMSSLGFQTVFGLLNELPGVSAERAFLPDAELARGEGLQTYESSRPVSDFPVVAFSLAWELELAGLVQCLDLAALPARREDRDARHPLVVVGGPLTFSNPVPAGPFADVIVLGEAELVLPELVAVLTGGAARPAMLADLARLPGLYVPSVHGERLPALAPPVPSERLPARSRIVTAEAELSDMFLIEAERGCHRTCAYCVMRRSPDLGGMRLVPAARIAEAVPAGTRRVGLVGAAVTDHPEIRPILRGLVDAGREVGISSLRADRLDDELAGLLRQGGLRTLTTAMDGASQRLRDTVNRGTGEHHLMQAATLCRTHGFSTLKLYLMLGLPGETDEDVEELGRFALELARAAPRVVLAAAPFVAKRRTPLDGAPFADQGVLSARLARLRSLLRGRAELRVTSPRWAWFEYRLAQGGFAEGEAAAVAARSGAGHAAWKRAFAEVPLRPRTD